MSAIDLVVTDLDGTLWDADERIHERSLAALRELETRSVPLLVATGRRPRSAAAGLAREGLTPPAVLLDGAIGKDLATGRVFHEAGFAPADAVRVLDAFESAGLSPCAYVSRPDADVVVGPQPSSSPRHLDFVGRWLAFGDVREVAQSEHVLAFGIVGRDLASLWEVAATVGEVAQAVVARDPFFGGATLMVRPPGISKWEGVLAFCEEQGLDADRVLALGDGENDVELLTGAAVAVVVRDGCEAALALADHVIEPAATGGWGAVLDLC